jgi:hypothetical protein
MITIEPKQRALVPLDLVITPLPGTFAQIFSCSGLSVKHKPDITARTIDRDYTENVMVLLQNSGDGLFTVNVGVQIAQFIILSNYTPNPFYRLLIYHLPKGTLKDLAALASTKLPITIRNQLTVLLQWTSLYLHHYSLSKTPAKDLRKLSILM